MKHLAVNYTLKYFVLLGCFMLNNCGSTAPILSTPIENIDQTPVKFSAITEDEEKIGVILT